MMLFMFEEMLRKLDLSQDQLKGLRERLIPDNICKGPFLQGDKKCPITTALVIKEGPDTLKDAAQVRARLRNYGIGTVELMLFYALFDIPAIISDIFFKRSIMTMHTAIDELIEVA
ncbi:MAG TPA: hypothetical protein VJG64_03530 [Candidatus Paceibacterota bacterium]